MGSKTSIDLSLEDQELVILGTEYAGEMKKGVFTVANYMPPKRGILSMHCSATCDQRTGHSSLLFGLSGTGKTTLSADPKRHLIGDDEHCWSDEGIYNIEGGCYAKAVTLSPETSATFSACFGGPFLMWQPSKYAQLLAAKVRQHNARVWLVNTGWSGGGFGVGKRIKLAYTRTLVDAIHRGALASSRKRRDPVFGFEVVTECPGVPSEILWPRDAWADLSAYEASAKKRGRRSQRRFAGGVTVLQAKACPGESTRSRSYNIS
jgi:ATP-dependent phosphoenolpyruvate carboxykinase